MDKTDYNPHTVRAARIRCGIATQADAGKQLQVTEKTISRVETGIAASFDLLKRMAALYGANLGDWIRIDQEAA